MRLHTIKTILVLALLPAFANVAMAGTEREERTFDGIKVIKINTVSGDCVIQKGTGTQVAVEVVWTYRPIDSFEPRFSDRGGVLKLSEEMYESNFGNSVWTLTVPDSVEIRFSTSSGDLEVSGLATEVSGETASGDFLIDNCRGEFRLSSASGNIEVRSSSGEFDVSTASGDIRLLECDGEYEASSSSGSVESNLTKVAAPSSFSTASGSVEVVLAEALEFDLQLSSASGDVELNFDGHPIQGYFELATDSRDGRIESPFDFDDEELYREHGNRYVRKWFTKGGDKPEVFIQTASGTAVLAER